MRSPTLSASLVARLLCGGLAVTGFATPTLCAVPAAAGALPAVPDPAEQATAAEPRYVAPTSKDRIGRIWAPAYLNDQGPFRLVLDTGASTSAVTASTAAALQLTPEARQAVLLQAATGAAVVPTIALASIVIGDLVLHGTRVPIVADAFGGADGILGSEGLQDKRIYIDFLHDRVAITRSRNEPPAPGFIAIAMQVKSGLVTITDVRIGPLTATAIIDTGAQVSLANSRLCAALLRASDAGTYADTVVGNTLDVEAGLRMTVPTIHLGGMQIRGASVIAGDIHFFVHRKLTRIPALLLGMDTLGLVDVLIIDYRRHEVQMLPRSHS